MFKVILITALVGAVWTKGYPALKYEQTKVDDDDHGLIDEDEVRPQYMKPVYQTQVEYNDEQDLIAEDVPEEKYEQKSVDAFPKRIPSYGGKLRPEGKQGTYKGSDISSEIKHKKNSYESTKISQEEYEVKTVDKDYGDRLPSYSKKETPKAYKTPEIPSTKRIYQKKTSEEDEYAGNIGQSNAQDGSGIKQSYNPKPSYVAPAQEQVEVDLKSTSYKGGKGKGNSGYSPKQIVVDSGMRPGHYGSQGVYMGYSVYKMKDAYNNAGLDNKHKSTSYQAPQTYGIYKEGAKNDYSSSSRGSGSSHQGYGNTGYHSGQSNSGSYHQTGFNSANNEQKQYGGSGYGENTSKHQSSYGGSGSEYSGIGGASGKNYESAKSSHDSYGTNTGSHLQSGTGYKSNHESAYNGYKASGQQGIKSSTASGYGLNTGSQLQSGSGYKSNHGASHSGYKSSLNHGSKSSGSSGYGHSTGSHLQSDSGYKSNYGTSHNGYKSSGIGNAGASGYGISAGSHLQSGSGYKGGYEASHNGYKASGIKSTGLSGYGISSGSHLQSGSGYKGGYDASQGGYKASVIGNAGASGYGINAGSHLQSGSGYKGGYEASHNGYKASGIKSTGLSGYGISSGSHLQSGSGYKGGYDASQGGYKASGIKSTGSSGYGISSGSHLQSGPGYKGGYDASQGGYKASGIKSTGSSGYGISSGSHLQGGSEYKGGYDASHGGYKSSGIKSTGSSGYGISSGSHLQGGSGYKGGYDASHGGYKVSGIKSTGSSGYGISSGSHLQSGSGYKSGYDAYNTGYKASGNQGIKSSHASGYGKSSGSHSQSDLGYKNGLSNSGHYGHSSSSHLGYQSYGNGGSASGIGGHSQYHTSTSSGLDERKHHGNKYGSEYNHGIGQVNSGINTGSSYGKVARNYGLSHLGRAGYERGHQRNLGKSYHTSSKTYAPASYHNTKSDGYQKSIKSSGGAGSYSGGIGESAGSGIKSSTGYHGSNLGVSSYGNKGKKSATGSGSHYPKGSYQQPKITQQKHVDDYLESGKSDDGVESPSYKGIEEISKGHPTASKTLYPTHSKSHGSSIKGGSKTPKYPAEYQDNLSDKYQPSYGSSDSYGISPASAKGYSTKGGSGIKGGPTSGGIEVSAKKSPYQPITASHASGGYSYPSFQQPRIGSSDKYEPKKIEQKDLSYEAILGSPGSSSSGSGSGGYGFTSSGGPSSGTYSPVYGSDDKYEMSKPMPYEFKYEIKDDEHGADQYREEKMDDNGYLTGRYGYKDPYGLYRQVEYQASKDGFKVSSIKTNEPGTDNQDPADVHFEVEKGHQQQY